MLTGFISEAKEAQRTCHFDLHVKIFLAALLGKDREGERRGRALEGGSAALQLVQ